MSDPTDPTDFIKVWIKPEPNDDQFADETHNPLTIKPEIKAEDDTFIKFEIQSDDYECITESTSDGPIQLEEESSVVVDCGTRLICKVCGQTFKNTITLSKHQKKHTGEYNARCDECGEKFLSTFALKIHERLHTGIKPFQCDTCGKAFISNKYLAKHLFTHLSVKPHACDECGMTFSEKYKLNLHKHTHSTDRDYACDECGKTYKTMANLKFHKKRHIDDKKIPCENKTIPRQSRIQCTVCGQSFTSQRGLKEHLDAKHTGNKPYGCDLCEMTFAYKASVAQHKLHKHSDERPFHCDQCERRFNKQWLLDQHKYQHTGERPFRCEECGLGFIKKLYLNTHKLKHSGEKPFPCDECSSRFGTKRLLIQHKRIHAKNANLSKLGKSVKKVAAHVPTATPLMGSNQRPATNEIEGCIDDDDHKKHESIVNLSNINRSRQRHENNEVEIVLDEPVKVRPLSKTVQQPLIFNEPERHHWNIMQAAYCNEAVKKVKDEFELNHLVKMVETPNPISNVESRKKIELMNHNARNKSLRRLSKKHFSCTECEEKFPTSKRLKIHQRWHTNKDRYMCDECGKPSDTLDKLRMHKDTHSVGFKKFECDICGIKMGRKYHLRDHIIRHVGLKRNCCDECSAKFVTKSDLLSHKKHFHRKKDIDGK